MFHDYNSPNYVVSFNGDQVVTPIMGNLNIMQPGVFEQHGIVGVQNVVAHDYKSNNERYMPCMQIFRS